MAKICQTIAYGSIALALGTMGYFTENYKICLVIMTLGYGLRAGMYSGHVKSVLDLSRNYCGTVCGYSNGFGCVAGILAPLVRKIELISRNFC